MSPASDQRVRETFVELADTLVDEFDVIDFLATLSLRAVELLGVHATGILLLDPSGSLNVVAASTDQARLLELFQLQNAEGPCLDCFATGEAVRCPELTAETERWPRFAMTAMAEGYRAVHALPMRLRHETIGAINMFSSTAGPLGDETLELGQALADVATIGILHERAARRHEVLAEQLQSALDSRVVIEQAKGILAGRLGVTVAEAFRLMRGRARRTNARLAQLAAGVVDGTVDPGLLAAGRGHEAD